MRISYNNIDKPKNYAKNLKKNLATCEMEYSLTECQKMIAIMSGYHDWKELKNQIGKTARFIPENISSINIDVWKKEFNENLMLYLMRFFARNMTSISYDKNFCNEVLSEIFPNNYHNKSLILVGSVPNLPSNINPIKNIVSHLSNYYHNGSFFCFEYDDIDNVSKQKKEKLSKAISGISFSSPDILYCPHSINSSYIVTRINKVKSDRTIVKTHGRNAKEVLQRWINLSYEDNFSVMENISKVIYYSVVDGKLVYDFIDFENENIKDFLNC